MNVLWAERKTISFLPSSNPARKAFGTHRGCSRWPPETGLGLPGREQSELCDEAMLQHQLFRFTKIFTTSRKCPIFAQCSPNIRLIFAHFAQYSPTLPNIRPFCPIFAHFAQYSPIFAQYSPNILTIFGKSPNIRQKNIRAYGAKGVISSQARRCDWYGRTGQ